MDFDVWVRQHADTAVAYRRDTPPKEELLAILAICKDDAESVFGLTIPKDTFAAAIGIVARQKDPDYLALIIDTWIASVQLGESFPAGRVRDIPGRSEAMVVIAKNLRTGERLTISVRYFRHEDEWVFDEPFVMDGAETHFFEALP